MGPLVKVGVWGPYFLQIKLLTKPEITLNCKNKFQKNFLGPPYGPNSVGTLSFALKGAHRALRH